MLLLKKYVKFAVVMNFVLHASIKIQILEFPNCYTAMFGLSSGKLVSLIKTSCIPFHIRRKNNQNYQENNACSPRQVLIFLEIFHTLKFIWITLATNPH